MKTNDSMLAGFLASGKLLAEATVNWGDMPLEFAYYQSTALPPLEYISSVRAIVFQGDSVLVIKSRFNQFYILPGGRCEQDESPEETLRREMLEETGWTLRDPQIIGFIHFHHLGPEPADYTYPYPDFIWLICSTEADRHFPEAIQPDDYVKEASFQPLNTLQTLNIEKGELALLDTAIRLRHS